MSPSAISTSPKPGFIRRNRTVPIMSEACGLAGRPGALGAVALPAPDAQNVDRPGARPDLSEPIADSASSELLCDACRLERVVSPCKAGRQHGGMGAAGPVGRAVAVARPVNLLQTPAVEEH